MSLNPYYLHATMDGDYRLSTVYEYYYQVQGQLGITDRSFCDFVCWTPQAVHIEKSCMIQLFFFFAKMEVKLQRFLCM